MNTKLIGSIVKKNDEFVEKQYNDAVSQIKRAASEGYSGQWFNNQQLSDDDTIKKLRADGFIVRKANPIDWIKHLFIGCILTNCWLVDWAFIFDNDDELNNIKEEYKRIIEDEQKQLEEETQEETNAIDNSQPESE